MKKENNFKLGLTFDDVLIIPKYSKIISRKLINLETYFSKNIKLNIPIVSANMDTVTEAQMAIAMAREGGIGIIHRFMTAERQVQEVRRVKRAETFIISDPVTVSRENTLAEVLETMGSNGVTGVLVVDGSNRLEGILTARDVRFQANLSVKVGELMTPRSKLITAGPTIKKEEAIKIFDQHKIEKLPLVDRKGVLQGLIAAADFTKTSRYRKAAKDKHGRLMVGAAIGIKDGEERAERLVKAGADALVIDIAHGHHQIVIKLLRKLKLKYKKETDVVVGNIATAAAAKDLIRAGADALKVGIGPGKACSTRVIAGSGMPQFSAILNCCRALSRGMVPVIADGGIRSSGDLAKAIGAGASTVMIGSLLAGTKESPGEYFIEDGAAFKIYRGLASRSASIDRSALENNSDRPERAAEGISTTVSYKGDAVVIIQNLIDGLQSGMSYSGAENIKEFWRKADFIRVTEAGFKEGLPKL